MHVTTTYKYNDDGLLTKKTENNDGLVTKYTYKYSDFYKGKKQYPKVTKVYYNDRLDSKIISKYKMV